ncbi:hypothetical protein [Mycolicibacterium frederiksbergense]|uniref:hypothetical protein n=1 Tax=Mycolicibacterium frederiksbergense TaxID=117567 RepID=UPI00265BB736|nr:hypothetical protein [Mycolicibacterium frederiksbergense]MDO0975530.1 hypothetical protein [Mycolicibacterium frederiksbergense]
MRLPTACTGFTTTGVAASAAGIVETDGCVAVIDTAASATGAAAGTVIAAVRCGRSAVRLRVTAVAAVRARVATLRFFFLGVGASSSPTAVTERGLLVGVFGPALGWSAAGVRSSALPP